MNSILVLTSSVSLFDTVEDFIKKLDVPSQDIEPHIFIYFLKNSQSPEMSALLNSVFSKQSEEKTPETESQDKEKPEDKQPNLFSSEKKIKETTVVRKAALSDFGSGTLRGEIRITEDEIRNALIIEAMPSDYLIIKKVLKRLDILPRQVLISVTLAEVQLNDDLDLGVEWSWSNLNDDTSDHPSFWSADITGLTDEGGGLTYAIGQATKWRATLNALAQKQRVNILSSPSILASDNKKATINIATEVPVASAQIQYDTDNTEKTQTDIQYRTTGVILDVTPHINEFGLVSMDISQEVSEQSKAVAVGNASYPSFFKRTLQTTLTVNNRQTIVIGGLISETESDSNSGLPFLSDLPFIGWIFGTEGQGLAKTELIVLITPTVVANIEDVDAVTREFANKVSSVEREFADKTDYFSTQQTHFSK